MISRLRQRCGHSGGPSASHSHAFSGSARASPCLLGRPAAAARVSRRVGRSPPHRAARSHQFARQPPDILTCCTQCGADYTLLRDLLAGCEWEKADNETRLKLCQLAGEEAEAREWVYYSEVKDIPAVDLQTIDALWKGFSKGRYGFSVQRAIWLAEKRKWGGLFTRIGWTMGENKAYRKFPNEFLWSADAPKGHLPLTNCLRGTQLFSALLEHPAFGGALEPMGVRAQGNGQTSIGGYSRRTGPPPLESLGPTQRAALAVGALALIGCGLITTNSSGAF